MNLSKRISKILLFLLIGLVFSSGVASAEYLGPDRVKTKTITEACEYGVWAHKASDTGEICKDANGNVTEGCTDCTWECNPGSPCGIAKYSYSLGTKLVEHSVTVTYPEATIASTSNCAVWGDAGWCVQPSSVTITANEPVAEKVITLIEGTHNGGPFACAADTCTVNMVEGSNSLTYWALSSFGDSSRIGNRTVLQDTVAPEINASVTGTMGENGWFISNAILSVVFSDPTPGSGLTLTSALFSGASTDVTSPVTLTEGVYNIQLDTRDAAGWTASTAQIVYVDTTSPIVTANQPPVEVSNSGATGGGYMNGSVVFTGTYGDATSGVSQIQISPDGSHWFTTILNADGTWTYDWESSQAKDGSYNPLAYAMDNAGNRTDISMQPITLDNSAPAMSMTGGWYIWESGHIVVYDTRVGIERIELSVRDTQNRWPAREWEYDTSKLEMDLQWDRKFGDGTLAPTGTYEVLIQAWDKLGNGRWITSRIYIPEAGATAEIPLQGVVSGGTFESTSTPMAEEIETEESSLLLIVPQGSEPAPTASLQPSSTPSTMNFSSVPMIPASGSSKSTSLPVDPNLLTGAAALAAAASATAYSLQKKKEMDEEIKREEAQSRAEAMAKVRAAEATKVANYLQKLANDKIQAEKAEYMELIARTGGHAITDLSDEQFQDFINQGEGAYLAAKEYIEQQQNASEVAQKQAELNRQSATAYTAAAGFIASQERIKSENDAKDYANQIKSFQQGEANSIDSYEAYKAYHDKMDKVEQLTENYNVIKQKAELPTTQSLPMTGMTASLPSTNYYPMNGGYTQEELQGMIDENIEKIEAIEEKPKEHPVWDWMKDRYMTIWDSFNSAKLISSSENATFWQKVFARNYMSGVVAIHLALAIGIGILTWEGVGAAYTAADTALFTAYGRALPTILNVTSKISSAPVIGPIVSSPLGVNAIKFSWDLGFNALLADAHRRGDEEAAGLLYAAYQIDGQISAGEATAVIKYLESRSGSIASGGSNISELLAKNSDDLAKVINEYRLGKFEGTITEESEKVLSYLSKSTDMLKFVKGSESGGTLIYQFDKAITFSESEVKAANYFCELGDQVVLRVPHGTRAGGGTSDLIVNGIRYEVYTPITGNIDRIISGMAKKNSQTTVLVVDLSETQVTAEQLYNAYARVKGSIESSGEVFNLTEIIFLP